MTRAILGSCLAASFWIAAVAMAPDPVTRIAAATAAVLLIILAVAGIVERRRAGRRDARRASAP